MQSKTFLTITELPADLQAHIPFLLGQSERTVTDMFLSAKTLREHAAGARDCAMPEYATALDAIARILETKQLVWRGTVHLCLLPQ